MAVADAHLRSRHGRQICWAGARPEERLRLGTAASGEPHLIQAPLASRRCSNWRAGCTLRHLLREVHGDFEVLGFFTDDKRPAHAQEIVQRPIAGVTLLEF